MNHLLLLHGAIGAKDQLEPLRKALSPEFNATALNFSGHGRAPFQPDFSMAGFAQEVLAWLDGQGLQQVPVLGYSMGGYVALYLAAHHPDRISKVMTIATKLAWSEAAAAKEAAMLQPQKLQEKVPAFAQQLKQRHGEEVWERLLQKTADLLQELGATAPLTDAVFRNINIPVLLSLGDRDNMVTLEETVAVRHVLPAAQLLVLPGTGHPVEKLPVELVALAAQKFFS